MYYSWWHYFQDTWFTTGKAFSLENGVKSTFDFEQTMNNRFSPSSSDADLERSLSLRLTNDILHSAFRSSFHPCLASWLSWLLFLAWRFLLACQLVWHLLSFHRALLAERVRRLAAAASPFSSTISLLRQQQKKRAHPRRIPNYIFFMQHSSQANKRLFRDSFVFPQLLMFSTSMIMFILK